MHGTTNIKFAKPITLYRTSTRYFFQDKHHTRLHPRNWSSFQHLELYYCKKGNSFLQKTRCTKRNWATTILKYFKVSMTAISNIYYGQNVGFYYRFLPFQRADSIWVVHELLPHLLTTVRDPLFIQEFKSFAFQKMVPASPPTIRFI